MKLNIFFELSKVFDIGIRKMCGKDCTPLYGRGVVVIKEKFNSFR